LRNSPGIVVAVKALACELPSELGLPLSRFSMGEIKREVIRRGIVASIGETTIWRWLSQDAIRPWTHRSWIFPRDPDFAQKASRVLDLYEGIWEGRPLGRTTSSPAPTRRPAFRPAGASTEVPPHNPAARCVSSTSTCAREPGRIWLLGMSIRPGLRPL